MSLTLRYVMGRYFGPGTSKRGAVALQLRGPVLRAQRGDPGLFSFVGKALKTVGKIGVGLATGGPAGAIAAGLSTVGLKSGPPVLRGTTPLMPGSGSAGLPTLSVGGAGPGGAPGVPGEMDVARPPAMGTDLVPYGRGGCMIQRGGFLGFGQKPYKAGHPNKSRYYRFSDGEVVEPGSRCVPNRRMNPLNPRAASRAMRRLISAKKAARFLDKIHIGGKPRRASGGKSCGKKIGCKCR